MPQTRMAVDFYDEEGNLRMRLVNVTRAFVPHFTSFVSHEYSVFAVATLFRATIAWANMVRLFARRPGPALKLVSFKASKPRGKRIILHEAWVI